MSEPFEYPETPINRGKVLDAKQLEELGGFARYKDVDGDAIPYRTLPGTDHPTARRLPEQHAASGAEIRDSEDAGAPAGA
jgi:hypothetical protein